MHRVLIVDDDTELSAMLCEYLARENFAVEAADDGFSGARRALSGDFDIAVLDVAMPTRSGLDTLREIRASSQLPVLMLTARGDDVDKVVGLELGADDYVPKPCTPRELMARLRAILRRTGGHDGSPFAETAAAPQVAANSAEALAERQGECLVAGGIALWPRSRRVHWQGQTLALSSTQFSILEVLVREAGTAVSKQEISRRALARPLGRFDRSIDVHISILRQKLGGPQGGDALIKTVRGIGYQLAVD
jgi:two-component system, OmpR family, response regulator